MATPTSFPAWLQRSDGSSAQVNDVASYNGAVLMGWTYPTAPAMVAAPTGASVGATPHVTQAGAPVTPAVVVAQTGALTTTIKQSKQNKEQDDGR